MNFPWMKFVHKQMPQFEINITIQVTCDSLNDSTIPTVFRSVTIYTSPVDRETLVNSKQKMQMNEFKRALGTENLLSKCPSMDQLLSFLEYYHRKVIQTVTLVDNFFKVVDNNDAILEKYQK